MADFRRDKNFGQLRVSRSNFLCSCSGTVPLSIQKWRHVNELAEHNPEVTLVAEANLLAYLGDRFIR